MAKKYWVVSPNVKDNQDTVKEWKKASVDEHAAFMGYKPNDYGHIGPKFAGVIEGGIQPGHVILIARRKDGKPDVVGFGVVHGKYKHIRDLKGFKLPGNDDDDGSLRNLQPFKDFKDCRKPPRGILIKVLRHTQALVQRYPEDDDAHKKVCVWMDEHLGNKGGKADEKQRAITKSKNKRKLGLKSAVIVDPPENHKGGYEVQTKCEVIKAEKIEATLVKSYERWLKKKGRKLSTLKYNESLQCDRYEKKRQNLIEAKASTTRENIRMAVGQLLDYAFLGKEEFGESNKAILLPKKPDSDLEKWLRHLHISIIWRERESFRDNADGRFS